jgi:hypothetical protein
MFNHHTMSETNVVLTPIAKNYKPIGQPDSRRDYEEQCVRAAHFKQMMWDDSRFNKSKVGDILIFYLYNIGVHFHRITDVHSPSMRLPTWSLNIGQHERNVLYVDDAFASWNWQKWIETGGAARCQGTQSLISAKDSILTELRS